MPDKKPIIVSSVGQWELMQTGDTVPVINGGTGVATSTGNGSVVLNLSPTLTTPIINVGSDATGDVYYRNSAGAFVRLAIGTSGNVLSVAAGLPSWAAPSTQWTTVGNDINYATGLVQIVGDAGGAAVSTTKGLQVINNTAATASVQQWSPPIRRIGQGWKSSSTAASQTVEIRDYIVPVTQSLNPFIIWNTDSVINGAVVNILNYNSGITTWTMPTSSIVVGASFSVTLSPTGVATINQNTVTSSDGFVSQHRVGVTNASAGIPVFISPRMRLTGAAWTGAASQQSDWIVENIPVSGTTPITSKLTFSSQINAAGYNARMILTNAGQLSIGGSAPVTSAILQMDSVTRGFLVSRMTTIEKNAIASPAEGLEIYDLTLKKKCVYTGAAWETMSSV